MPNKKKELIKNTLIIALGSMSVQFVSFLLLPFYTTRISTTGYGVVDLINTYSNLLIPVVSIQLGLGAFRFLIDARDDEEAKKKIISNALQAACIPIIISVVLFVLVERFIYINYAYWSLAIIVTALILSIFLQIARGLGKNGTFAIGSIISGVTAIISNIVLIAIYHLGVHGMLISSIVASFTGCLYLFYALRLYRYIDVSVGDMKLRKNLLRYSLPLIPSGISWWVIDASDRTIISLALGVSANGIYAVAYKFPSFFASIASYFSLSWTESASLHINQKDRDQFFSEICNASIRFFGALTALMIACIALFFNLFIGHNFRQAFNYIPILIAASFFSSVISIYSAIYVAKKLARQAANTSILAAVINLLLTIISIKFIGMYGAALATVAGYLIMAVFRHYDTKKYVSLIYEKNVFLKVALINTFSISLYYYNHIFLNIVNAAITIVFALVLNRAIITIFKDRLLSNIKRLSPDQEVAEEVL